MSAVIHYKDLSEWYWSEHVTGNTPRDVALTVMVDPVAEDGYEYWVNRISAERPSVRTSNYQPALQNLTESVYVDAPVRPDVCVHIIAEPGNRDFCERLYWRGGDSCSWDLRDYTPGAMGIPEHVTHTPHLRGILTIGGAPDIPWREGRLWMDHTGYSAGFAVPVNIDRRDVTASVYELSRWDPGELIRQTAFARSAVHTNYWLQQLVGDPLLMRCSSSEYRHTRALGLDYRRRLDFMRSRIRRLSHDRA